MSCASLLPQDVHPTATDELSTAISYYIANKSGTEGDTGNGSIEGNVSSKVPSSVVAMPSGRFGRVVSRVRAVAVAVAVAVA